MEFLLLFWEYFKIGLFTIGGGYAMLPMVKQVVLSRGWLTEQQLINFVAISESTPGPFAINLATFVGINVGGSTSLGVFGSILGAMVATFAVVLPSLIIIIIVTKLYDKFRTNKYVQGVLFGIRPIVVGLVLSAVFSIGIPVFLPDLDFTNINANSFDTFNHVSLIFFVLLFVVSKIKIKGKKLHPILMIVLSAAVGVVLFGALELHL